MKKLCLVVMGMLICNSVFAESITLTTYYPAPFGAYDQIQLVPRNAAPPCQVGTLYSEDTNNTLQYCRDRDSSGTPEWEMLEGLWGKAGDFAVLDEAFFNNNLRIGIGDISPDALLEISASGQGDDFIAASSDDNNDGNAFIIKNDGKVGIGNSAPAFHFTVEGPSVNTTPLAYFKANGAADNQNLVSVDVDHNHNSGYGIFRNGVQKWVIHNIGNAVPLDALVFNSAAVADTVVILQNGNVGIATTGPATALEVNGTVTATAYLHSSDENLKDEIQPITGSLDKVRQLRGVNFLWKKDGEKDLGIIAQDVEKVFPELVNTNPHNGMKSVKYDNLIAPLIEAIKEQQQQIERLNRRINHLENKR